MKQSLVNLASDPSLSKVAILGIGNEFNGDDAAGVEVIRTLRRRSFARSNVQLIEAATAPENFTGSLRRFQPDLVLMVDAAEMGEAPGAIAFLEMQDLDGFGASTHTLPPSTLASFLVHELNCRVALVGIQPAHLDFDSPLSDAVRQAVELVAAEIQKAFLSE